MIAYLAGPIAGVSPAEANDWRSRLSGVLSTFGIWTYSPIGGFNVIDKNCNREDAKRMLDVNRSAIRESHLLIANIAGRGKGFGTIREIEFACSIGKPVVLIGIIESAAAHDCVMIDPEYALGTFDQSVELWRRVLLDMPGVAIEARGLAPTGGLVPVPPVALAKT
jgi:nucleoside 2-deoxyribosyltransferase